MLNAGRGVSLASLIPFYLGFPHINHHHFECHQNVSSINAGTLSCVPQQKDSSTRHMQALNKRLKNLYDGLGFAYGASTTSYNLSGESSLITHQTTGTKRWIKCGPGSQEWMLSPSPSKSLCSQQPPAIIYKLLLSLPSPPSPFWALILPAP